MVLSSCRSPIWSSDGGEGELLGIYDHKHTLRLAQVSGEIGVYRFETCLTQGKADMVQSGSCVGALYKKDGSDITFSLERLAGVDLSQEEKERLARLHVSWKQYQGKQSSSRSKGSMAEKTASVVVGGKHNNIVTLGVVGGSAVALFGTVAAMRAGVGKMGEAVAASLIGLTSLGAIAFGMKRSHSSSGGKKINTQGLSAAAKKELERIEHVQLMVDQTYLMHIDPSYGSRLETIKRNQLTTPDDPYSIEVSSVEPLLNHLARYQRNLGLTTRVEEDKISYYCLPTEFAADGTIQKSCHEFAEAQTWCLEADDDGVCLKAK